MTVLAEIVTRVLVVPELLEPFIFHPLMSTGEPVRLYNSMNSSLPPDGPWVRNSLMTTEVETDGAAGTGARARACRGSGAAHAARPAVRAMPRRSKGTRPARRVRFRVTKSL